MPTRGKDYAAKGKEQNGKENRVRIMPILHSLQPKSIISKVAKKTQQLDTTVHTWSAHLAVADGIAQTMRAAGAGSSQRFEVSHDAGAVLSEPVPLAGVPLAAG